MPFILSTIKREESYKVQDSNKVYISSIEGYNNNKCICLPSSEEGKSDKISTPCYLFIYDGIIYLQSLLKLLLLNITIKINKTITEVSKERNKYSSKYFTIVILQCIHIGTSSSLCIYSIFLSTYIFCVFNYYSAFFYKLLI